MNAAESIIQRERKASMDVIKKCSEESCKEGYEKEWHHSSHEVLQQNRINTYVYGDADRDLLTCGSGKFRNMIVGPANFRKTFMLKQLEHIYHAYCNPKNDKYRLVQTKQKKFFSKTLDGVQN